MWHVEASGYEFDFDTESEARDYAKELEERGIAYTIWHDRN